LYINYSIFVVVNITFLPGLIVFNDFSTNNILMRSLCQQTQIERRERKK